MKVVVFDVETTGLPKNRYLPINDPSWPYIVQFAWLVLDDELMTIKEHNYIIKSEIQIPEAAIKIHGITNEIMNNYGVDIKGVLNDFIKDLRNATHVVAHNLNFDWKMLTVGMYRNKMYNFKFNIIKYCTMRYGNDLYRFRSKKTGRMVKKWPKLKELHTLLFKEELNNNSLHDALSDTLVCLRCYYKMIHNSDILKEIPSLTKAPVFLNQTQNTNNSKAHAQ